MSTVGDDRIQSSDVLSLFPTCIWKIQLNPASRMQINTRIRELLLLFSACLQHSVDPDRSEPPRISIANNIMFSEFAENLVTS